MSTVPGKDSWRDAGLTRPSLRDTTEADPSPFELDEIDDEQASDELRDEEAATDVTVVDPAAGVVEEYRPDAPRPDLEDKANVADVTEQTREVPPDERDDYP
ncbi:hypothetical protein QUV83_15490 [Cellulomonas cellasea]|uniref:hypothetical protein n=1 Tax=Cellulomonas cellasea TaxID=43670 RepID=UPI0025A3ACF5|nr:hypothetical protein [Cellulomonas cellasea]MDM8086176.1 hypothetical protein [Cellulomonas cellasea]